MKAKISCSKSPACIEAPTWNSEKPFDQREDSHKKAQDAIDHAREVREERIAQLGKKGSPPPHSTDVVDSDLPSVRPPKK